MSPYLVCLLADKCPDQVHRRRHRGDEGDDEEKRRRRHQEKALGVCHCPENRLVGDAVDQQYRISVFILRLVDKHSRL